MAVVIVWGLLVFFGLALAFGYPLANGITHLADNLPRYVSDAENGRGGSAIWCAGITSSSGWTTTCRSW